MKLRDAPPQQNVEIQQHQQHSSSSSFQQQQFESSSFQQQSVTSSTTQQVLNGSFEVSPVCSQISTFKWTFGISVCLVPPGAVAAECISLCPEMPTSGSNKF